MLASGGASESAEDSELWGEGSRGAVDDFRVERRRGAMI